MSSQIAQIGYYYALILLVITGLLILSVFNPAVSDAINRGADPVMVIATYATFWTDLWFLVVAMFALIVKIVIKGAEVVQQSATALEALTQGNLIGFLLYFAVYLNFLDVVGRLVTQLIGCWIQRLTNTIAIGRVLAFLRQIYAW